MPIQMVDRPDPTACHQTGCEDKATHIVFWPGKTPPPRYCTEHTTSARNILAAMGTPVHVQPIVPMDEDFPTRETIGDA